MRKLQLTTSLLFGGMMALAGNTLLGQSPPTSPNPNTTPPGSASQSTLPSTSLGQTSGSLGQPATGNYGASSQWDHGAQHHARLSHLMNATVQSKDGRTLGYIRDFTIDPQSGRIEFAVLSRGMTGTPGALGNSTPTQSPGVNSSKGSEGSSAALGSNPSTGYGAYNATGKLIPVPWQLFSESWNGQHSGTAPGTFGANRSVTTMGTPTLVLNIDESKLQSAPSIEGNNWNELQQGQFDQRVYSYFGVNRMSGAGSAGSSISGQGASSKDYNKDLDKNAGDRSGRNDVPK
jgi:sporulation protein YlmC with PRC-barrel domain